MSASMVGAPTPARAFTPPTAEPAGDARPPEPAAEDPALAKARELYEQGEARFATADYFAAIELWTQAFTMVPDTADAARIQAALIFDIATAREKAFEVSGDLTHLRQAKLLMEDYIASIPALYGDGPEAEEERGRITTRLNAIVRQIEEVERERRKTTRSGPTDSRPDGDPKRARALIGSGGAAIGLAVGGFAMMTAGLVMGSQANDLSGIDPDAIEERRDQFEKGRTGNSLAIAGGVIGGVFIVTGAVLLGLGLAERRRALAFAPTFGRGHAGLAMRMRF
jgi:hypothetical protein